MFLKYLGAAYHTQNNDYTEVLHHSLSKTVLTCVSPNERDRSSSLFIITFSYNLSRARHDWVLPYSSSGSSVKWPCLLTTWFFSRLLLLLPLLLLKPFAPWKMHDKVPVCSCNTAKNISASVATLHIALQTGDNALIGILERRVCQTTCRLGAPARMLGAHRCMDTTPFPKFLPSITSDHVHSSPPTVSRNTVMHSGSHIM